MRGFEWSQKLKNYNTTYSSQIDERLTPPFMRTPWREIHDSLHFSPSTSASDILSTNHICHLHQYPILNTPFGTRSVRCTRSSSAVAAQLEEKQRHQTLQTHQRQQILSQVRQKSDVQIEARWLLSVSLAWPRARSRYSYPSVWLPAGWGPASNTLWCLRDSGHTKDRRAVPEDVAFDTITSMHCQHAHPGKNKTFELLRQKFVWLIDLDHPAHR